MEAIKKQASKLREQVAKQQQAVLRQLRRMDFEDTMVDDAELQCHQQLQNLYNSTRAAKHFQRDIVRGVEGFIVSNKKQMEIARKLVQDCSKYETENGSSDSPLAMAALHFGTSYDSIEQKREIMLEVLVDQVTKPLRASITGAPLEDARHLTHRYDRFYQEVEAQAAEVIRRRSKFRDPSVESVIKLKNAESRLTELKSSMMSLGKEATTVMLSVEDQQQQITFQKLLTLVDAERSYHQDVVSILEKLHAEMILEEQRSESQQQSQTTQGDLPVAPAHEHSNSNGCDRQEDEVENDTYFVAKVIHSFDAQTSGELNIEVDDYVVVHQVAPNGWSEGKCNGRFGWFPSAYVERRDEAPASKLVEASSL